MPEKNRITKKRLQTTHKKAGLLMLLLLFFQASTVLAQRPDSVKINGIYHYIYPYPQLAGSSSLFESVLDYQMESSGKREKISRKTKKRFKIVLKNPDLFCEARFKLEKDVTPSLDPLPDGKYVQYYTEYYKLNKKKKFIPDSTKFAGFFELQDNLLEGNAYWINTLSDTVKKGKFHQGLKEGVWTLLSSEYINIRSSTETLEKILKEGPVYTVQSQTFANGIYNGAYLFTDRESRVKGFYTDGEESGEWSFYEKKSPGNNSIDSFVLVRHYILNDHNIKSHKPFVRSSLLKPGNLKYYQLSGCGQKHIHFGVMRKLNGEDKFESEYNSSYYDKARGQNNYPDFIYLASKVTMPKSELIHSGYINRYRFYEEFYLNGQLKTRMKFENGNLLSEDTIFSDNGKPMDVVLFDAGKNQYENKLFDCEGTVYEINLYDSLGVFVKQVQDPFYRDKHIFIDGIECFFEDEIFRYRNPDFFTQPLQGEILLNKSWYADTSECNERRYNADARKLISEMKSINGKKMEEYSCTFSPDFNTASGFRIYYLKELKSVQSFTQNYYKALLETEDSLIRRRLRNPGIEAKVESEIILKYKDEPFNGKAVFRFDRKTPYFSIQKNSIKIDLARDDEFYEIQKKDYESYLKTGKTKYPDVFSITQTSNYRKALYNIFPVLEATGYWNDWDADYNERNRIFEGKFVNGKPEGTWIMYNKERKIIKKIRYVDGKMNGVYQQYDIQQPRKKHFDTDFIDTFPERATLFLSQETSYGNGVKNGPTIYYDWLGNVIRKEHFKNGVSSGEAFERNSMVLVTLNFENGLKQGVERTTIHVPGKDSLLIRERTFERGALQGEAREYHTNGKLAKKEFFDHGKRVWIHEMYDSLGNMTMQLKYKNFLPFEQSFWESGELNIKYEFSQRDSADFNKNVLSRSGLDNQLIDFNYQPARGRGGAQFYKNLVRYNYTKPIVQKRERRMTKYFPNGNIARTGDLKEDAKTGLWKYFSYNGQKMYEVNYFDTTIFVNDSLKFRSYGVLSAFDEKEVLVSKSHVIEKSEKYDCSNSDHYEIRQFYTFWQAGNMQNKTNGFVKNYYDNGVLQSEGNMQNGLPTGIWKFYDPFGKLNEVGEYKTGKREGRWIKGDLEKIKYLGDICMDPNLPNLEEKIKYRENMIDIQILYFKHGTLITTEYYDLNLNK